MDNRVSYVITDGEGTMYQYGSCLRSDLFIKLRAAADCGLSVMFGPYDGTGE